MLSFRERDARWKVLLVISARLPFSGMKGKIFIKNCLFVLEKLVFYPFKCGMLLVSLERKKEKHCMSVKAPDGAVIWVCRNHQWEMGLFPSFQALHCLRVCACVSLCVCVCLCTSTWVRCVFLCHCTAGGGEHQCLCIFVHWCALRGTQFLMACHTMLSAFIYVHLWMCLGVLDCIGVHICVRP